MGKRIRNINKSDQEKWKWTIEKKFNKEIEMNKKKVRKMVLQKFHKWLKEFEKTESKKR